MEVVLFSPNGIIKKKKEKEESINQSLILFKIPASLYAPLLVHMHFLFGFDKEMLSCYANGEDRLVEDSI